MKKLIISLIFILSFIQQVFSFSYHAYSLMTGKNTFVINPFIFGDGSGYIGSETYIAYGLSDRSDMWNSIYVDNNNNVNFSAMLRYDLTGKNTIVALKADGYSFSPQFHNIIENNRFAFQSNISTTFSYDYIKKPSFNGIFCPVLKFFGGFLDIYCEFNPNYSTKNKNFNFDIVPGIGFVAGITFFSLACPIIDLNTNPYPSFGIWWFFAITEK